MWDGFAKGQDLRLLQAGGCHILPFRVHTNRNSNENEGLQRRQTGSFYFSSKALPNVRSISKAHIFSKDKPTAAGSA